MTDKAAANHGGTLHQLGPVVIAATMFSLADVFVKLALEGGADTLSMLSFRSVLGIVVVFLWLRLGTPAPPLAPPMRWIALGLGLLFAGNLLGVFKAIELAPVPIAILIYFVYPLLTGFIGAATGLDRLTLGGVGAALAAFVGLALIVGANPGAIAPLAILAAIAGALCRAAMLLLTRAKLADADPRLVTWYTLWASMIIFAALSLAQWDWHWPHTVSGWVAFIGIGFTTTAAILAIYVSAQRIGPFRTALYMNLEPFLTAVLSAILLGDRLAPLQILGGAVMIAALCLFQMRR